MDFKQRMALANELVGLLKTLSDKSIPTIERIDSSKRRIEILKELKQRVSKEEEPQIIKDYRAGKFAEIEGNKFKEKMIAVNDLGMSLSDIKAGLAEWGHVNGMEKAA